MGVTRWNSSATSPWSAHRTSGCLLALPGGCHTDVSAGPVRLDHRVSARVVAMARVPTSHTATTATTPPRHHAATAATAATPPRVSR